MRIQHFFDPRTSTLTYVVHDEEQKVGVVIDPVLDYEPKGGRIFHESVEAVARYIGDSAERRLESSLLTHPV